MHKFLSLTRRLTVPVQCIGLLLLWIKFELDSQKGFSLFAPTVVDENGNAWVVAYAIMDSEKVNDSLLWVLKQLATLCPPLANVNKAVFTDKGFSFLFSSWLFLSDSVWKIACVCDECLLINS